MDIRDFAKDEFADENIGVFGDGLCNAKDLLTLRMAPPATVNWTPRDGLGETRHGAARRLEHDAVALHEGQTLLWAHLILSPSPGPAHDVLMSEGAERTPGAAVDVGHVVPFWPEHVGPPLTEVGGPLLALMSAKEISKEVSRSAPTSSSTHC